MGGGDLGILLGCRQSDSHSVVSIPKGILHRHAHIRHLCTPFEPNALPDTRVVLRVLSTFDQGGQTSCSMGIVGSMRKASMVSVAHRRAALPLNGS